MIVRLLRHNHTPTHLYIPGISHRQHSVVCFANNKQSAKLIIRVRQSFR